MTAPPRPATVLVVDDDPLILMDLAELVRDLGHLALEAHSGPEALKAMETGPAIDALITDQAMPGMTGAQLARAARSRAPGLPVLICSGYADIPADAPDGVRQLKKPFDPRQLAAELARVLAAAP